MYKLSNGTTGRPARNARGLYDPRSSPRRPLPPARAREASLSRGVAPSACEPCRAPHGRNAALAVPAACLPRWKHRCSPAQKWWCRWIKSQWKNPRLYCDYRCLSLFPLSSAWLRRKWQIETVYLRCAACHLDRCLHCDTHWYAKLMGAESRMAIARGRRDGGWGEAGHTVSATKTVSSEDLLQTWNLLRAQISILMDGGGNCARWCVC